MIFVTVGTHPQQFDRLLKKVDELVERHAIKEEVFAQTGHSAYKPKNFRYKKFLTLDEFENAMKKADVVITHGGEGSIGNALLMQKRMIIVPRLRRFGEHTNDHQLELTKAVEEEGRALAVYDATKLEQAIKNIKNFKVKKYEAGKKIIELLEGFVKRCNLE